MKILNMNIPPIPYIDMDVGTGGGGKGANAPQIFSQPKKFKSLSL